MKKILGIDIGGSGVKGAIVNTKKGELITERYRIPTPQPATPEAVAKVMKKITQHFDWTGPVSPVSYNKVWPELQQMWIIAGLIKTSPSSFQKPQDAAYMWSMMQMQPEWPR